MLYFSVGVAQRKGERMSQPEHRMPTKEELAVIVERHNREADIEEMLNPPRKVVCPACGTEGTDKAWAHTFRRNFEIGIGVKQLPDCLRCSNCRNLFDFPE